MASSGIFCISEKTDGPWSWQLARLGARLAEEGCLQGTLPTLQGATLQLCWSAASLQQLAEVASVTVNFTGKLAM